MISRRATLLGSTLIAIVPYDAAMGQAVLPPSSEVLANTVKDRASYTKMLASVDALRSVLNLILLETGKGSKNPREDFARFGAVRAPFENETFYKDLQSRDFSTSENKSLIDAAGKAAIPTGAKIEATLNEFGVNPKGRVGIDMLAGFYKLSQLRAVVDRKSAAAKDSWYCSVFPFTYFCAG